MAAIFKKTNKKHIKIISVVLVMTILLTLAVSLISPTRGNADPITTSSFLNWTAGTLSAACDKISDFLTAQNPEATARPYKNNKTFTEGSLQALKKAYDNAAALPAETTKSGLDMARMQLVRCVRELELKPTFDPQEPLKRLLNNYPDSNGQYNVEVVYPSDGVSMPGLEYDVLFLLDWSGSMSAGMMNGTTARKYTEDFITGMSEDIFESHPNSTISVLAMNGPVMGYGTNLSMNGNDSRIARETDFVGKGDYATIIKDVFQGPVTINTTMDSPAMMMRAAMEKLTATPTTVFNEVTRVNPDGTKTKLMNPATENLKIQYSRNQNSERIPVIVFISDFQILQTNTSYWNTLQSEMKKFADAYQNEILITFRFNHGESVSNGFSYYSPLQESSMMSYAPGLNKYAFQNFSQNQTYDDVLASIEEIFYNATPTSEGPYVLEDPMGDKFNYVVGSFDTSGRTDLKELTGTTIDHLKLEGEQKVERIYKIQSDYTKLTGEKPEQDKFKTNLTGYMNGTNPAGTRLMRATGAYYLVHDVPQAFLPVTQASIELYTYSPGTGGVNNIANYGKKADGSPNLVISGEDISQLGGTGTYAANEKLTSLPYLGPNTATLTRGKVLEIIKEHFPSIDNFTINDNFSTAGTLTVQFDVGRNVYKIYASQDAPAPTLDKTAAWTGVQGNAEIELTFNNVKSVYQEIEPSDVVFILDSSGSMSTSFPCMNEDHATIPAITNRFYSASGSGGGSVNLGLTINYLNSLMASYIGLGNGIDPGAGSIDPNMKIPIPDSALNQASKATIFQGTPCELYIVPRRARITPSEASAFTAGAPTLTFDQFRNYFIICNLADGANTNYGTDTEDWPYHISTTCDDGLAYHYSKTDGMDNRIYLVESSVTANKNGRITIGSASPDITYTTGNGGTLAYKWRRANYGLDCGGPAVRAMYYALINFVEEFMDKNPQSRIAFVPFETVSNGRADLYGGVFDRQLNRSMSFKSKTEIQDIRDYLWFTFAEFEMVDSAGTNYHAGWLTAEDEILNDLEVDNGRKKQIVFFTDGKPTDHSLNEDPSTSAMEAYVENYPTLPLPDDTDIVGLPLAVRDRLLANPDLDIAIHGIFYKTDISDTGIDDNVRAFVEDENGNMMGGFIDISSYDEGSVDDQFMEAFTDMMYDVLAQTMVFSINDYVDNRYFEVDIDALNTNAGDAYYDPAECTVGPVTTKTVDGVTVQQVSFNFRIINIDSQREKVVVKIPVKLKEGIVSAPSDGLLPTNYDPIGYDGGAWADYKDLNREDQTIYQETPYLETGEVYLYKVDSQNSSIKIENVKFKLYYDDGDGDYTNDVEVVSDRVYTTNSLGEIFVNLLPPGNYYFLETDATGLYILPSDPVTVFEVVNDQVKPVTLTVTNDRREAILHIRQVIINSEGKIQIPSIGYFNMLNVDPTDTTTAGDNYNLIGHSGFDKTPFSTYNVDISICTGYLVNDIIPQYYKYAGYIATTTEVVHNAADRNTSTEILLDYTNQREYWLTVYIEPSVSDPGNYSWDTEINDFGLVQVN